jgi:molybdopterin converting factor subunit 1
VKVTALLFARYRADAGVDRLELELPAGATVRSAADAVAARTGIGLAGAMCAVNERYSRPEEGLDAGDRVAFLPPVSGG